ncbi:hypothetical protein BH10ACT11_BH10ACT11_14910 [soil metagenome]
MIPDWGGRDETFEVALFEPPSHLVHISKRGKTNVSWSINLEPEGAGRTRVALRLRLGPVRYKRLAETVGDFFDLLTVAGMAAGLAGRLRETGRPETG